MMKNSEGMEAKLALQLFYILDDSGATFPQAHAILRMIREKLQREEQTADRTLSKAALAEVEANPHKGHVATRKAPAWKEPLL